MKEQIEALVQKWIGEERDLLKRYDSLLLLGGRSFLAGKIQQLRSNRRELQEAAGLVVKQSDL